MMYNPQQLKEPNNNRKALSMSKCDVCVCMCSFLRGLILVNVVLFSFLLAVADASNISIFTANIQKS